LAGNSGNPKAPGPKGLGEYLEYSRRAWGLIANISVVIPLINTFGSLLPDLPNSAQVTFVTTVLKIIIVYAIWSFRFSILKYARSRPDKVDEMVGMPRVDEMGGMPRVVRRRRIPMDRFITLYAILAIGIFGTGLVDQSLNVLHDVVATYILFFVSLTISFNLLATREYMLEKFGTDESKKRIAVSLFQRRGESVFGEIGTREFVMKLRSGNVFDIRTPDNVSYVVTFRDDNSDEIVDIKRVDG